VRVLVVSNLYPPHFHGGYEIRCAQIAEALLRSGDEVQVLTSTRGLPLGRLGEIRPRSELWNRVPVHRWLHQFFYGPQPRLQSPWTPLQASRELRDARRFLRLIREFEPDVVNWWSMNGLTKALLPMPSALGIPDVHWIEHPWMIDEYGPNGEVAAKFWRAVWDGEWGPRLGRPLSRRLGRAWEERTRRRGIPTRAHTNRPRHVSFVSEYLRTLYAEAGLVFRSSEVLHGGVPEAPFEAIQRTPDVDGPLRLLYAGQITRDRGLHTLVQSLEKITPRLPGSLTLSVAGDPESPYGAELRTQVERSGLDATVSFLGKIPHEQMPGVYARHDILVFVSARPEGLPLTMVEAMLAGCAVLTTGSGGAMEVAVRAQLPLFPENDPEALGALLERLVGDRAQVREIAAHGRAVARREFGFDRMLERWKQTLRQLTERPSPVPGK